MLGLTKQKIRTDDNIRNNKILPELSLKMLRFLNMRITVVKINRSNDKYKSGPAINNEEKKRITKPINQ